MKKITFLLFSGFSTVFFAQTGNVGINTSSPTNTLDVNGNLRVRKMGSLKGKPAFVLSPNEKGVVYKVPTDDLFSRNFIPSVVSIFKRNSDYAYKTLRNNKITALTLDETILINNQFLKYNPDGSFDVLAEGIYQVTFQMGVVTNFSRDSDLIIGVIDRNKKWIGRATQKTGSGRSFVTYTTTLSFKIGDKFYLGLYCDQSLTVQGTQTGVTGNGNVTNVTIIKYK